MRGCMGALDGLVVKCKKPSKSQTNKQQTHWNRKGTSAMLCLAMCDSRRRFTWYSMECVGSTSDITGYYCTELQQAIEEGCLPG